MQFPAKKNAGCPKALRDFPPRKGGILYTRPGCLGTPLPLSLSLCGRTDGHVTITSEPKFLGSIGYQISSAIKLRWRALPAGFANTHQKPRLGVNMTAGLFEGRIATRQTLVEQ